MEKIISEYYNNQLYNPINKKKLSYFLNKLKSKLFFIKEISNYKLNTVFDCWNVLKLIINNLLERNKSTSFDYLFKTNLERKNNIELYCKQYKIPIPKMNSWNKKQYDDFISNLIKKDDYYFKDINIQCLLELLFKLNKPIDMFDFLNKYYNIGSFINQVNNYKIDSSINKDLFETRFKLFSHLYNIKYYTNTVNNLHCLEIIKLIFDNFYPTSKKFIQIKYSKEYNDLNFNYEPIYSLISIENNEQDKIYYLSEGKEIGSLKNPFDINKIIKIGNIGFYQLLIYHDIDDSFSKECKRLLTKNQNDNIKTFTDLSDKIDYFLGQFENSDIINYIYYDNDKYPLILNIKGQANEYRQKIKLQKEKQEEQKRKLKLAENWKKIKDAIDSNNIDDIKHIIKNIGIKNIETQDKSILSYVIQSLCDLEIIKLLLKAGANAEFIGNYNDTLLHTLYVAGKCSHIDDKRKIAKLLINYGADPYQYDYEHRNFLMGHENDSYDEMNLKDEIKTIKKIKL